MGKVPREQNTRKEQNTMNENLAQLLENAQKGYYEYVGKKFNTIVENGDLQSIKTNIEFFGKMLDALNEGLKNGDINSKLINWMEFYLGRMLCNDFKVVLENIEDGEVEKIKTY